MFTFYLPTTPLVSETFKYSMYKYYFHENLLYCKQINYKIINFDKLIKNPFWKNGFYFIGQ